MDSNLQTSPPDSSDAKAAFRKFSNDASNRQYRRRSPISRSSSSEGNSPLRDRSVSPILSRDDLEKGADTRPGRDGRELDRDSSRNKYSRNSDSYRYSDRQSSRSSHGYSRHDNYVRHDKFADEGCKYDRLSSRSGRESRFSTHSDHPRQESDISRSKDYSRNADKYSRDRYDGSGHRSRDKEKESQSLEHQKYKDKDSAFDRAGSGRRQGSSFSEEMDRDRRRRGRDSRGEKGDYHRSSGDRKGDYTESYEESRGHRNDLSSGRERDNDKYHLKEGYKSGLKEIDGQKRAKERMKHDEWETNMEKDRYGGVLKEQYEEKSMFEGKNQESPAKKLKLFSPSKGNEYDKDADERRSSLEQAEETGGRVTMEQAHGNDVDITNDINAAKVAAMKAAELVNRNLIGAGHSNMTTEQKKKLLWGSKKSTPAEESGHRWDTALFGDRERQEKFNKLMSLRLPWYLWPIVGCERGGEGGAETRESRWQWSPSSREAAGTPAGFGETVHRWAPTKGWSHCWIRSLRSRVGNFCSPVGMLCDIVLYSCARTLALDHYGILRKNMLCWMFQVAADGSTLRLSVYNIYNSLSLSNPLAYSASF
ncbi:arginine/serine-rich coiled-coil protein 2 isoform X1 [Herrania umbratica]|uniref:Arginine/serine-rich coiled-coil protein 2 isoform X1 n=1 Tax=Herrania umbratica TaxID=108875 RepID=A0A6J1BDN1_9ROSI|nr:arginine/serine-rich coiled-coil protein 2 isoform X1 [Herrania umbratica]